MENEITITSPEEMILFIFAVLSTPSYVDDEEQLVSYNKETIFSALQAIDSFMSQVYNFDIKSGDN